MSRADEILAAVDTLAEGLRGADNGGALSELLGIDSGDVSRVLWEELRRGLMRFGASPSCDDPSYRDLLMIETGIELGVAAERSKRSAGA